jgi:hypothetical protein
VILLPISKGTSKEIIARNIAMLIKEGYPPSQASAIAYEAANKKPKKKK